jgi:sugar (pentulose or hexulose) kinase
LCSLAKLLWMTRRSTAVRYASTWLNVAEWIAFRITGHRACEPSLASRTGFFNVREAAPYDEGLALAGLSPDFLPEVSRAGEPWGIAGTGPFAGAVVTVAGHDDPVAGLGVGATQHTDVFNSCGTAEAFLRYLPDDVSDEAAGRLGVVGCTVGCHPAGGLRALGGFESGSLLAPWLVRLKVDERTRASLEDLAAALPAGARGVTVSDLWTDPRVHADADPAPEQLWRAVFEALAERGAAMLSAMGGVAGPHGRFIVSGGAARGATARAVKRERFGNVLEPVVGEAAARGAALLGGVAAGVFGSVAEVPAPELRDIG